MKPVRVAMRMCGKGLRAYWGWMLKTGEYMGDYYGPW